MKHEKIDLKSNSEKWNEFISFNISKEINNCFIGHNPCLAEIFEEVFAYKAEYYALVEDDSIIGLLPGFRIKDKFTSMPMFPSAGIFTKPGNDKLTLYKKILNQLGKYEIRDTVKFSEYVYDKKY